MSDLTPTMSEHGPSEKTIRILAPPDDSSPTASSGIGLTSPGGSVPGARLLVLCFDGTSNTFNEKGNTNVVRLFVALNKSRHDAQLCYYQPGIGTYISPTKPLAQTFGGLTKVLDMALATYLEDHILGGYRFLMENYRDGDKICLFGFSRGGYTARCLAGMLHNVGLLSKGNEELVPFAWRKYVDNSFEGVKRAHDFKKMARHVGVEFLGVWDTVTSVSFAGRTLPFTNNNVVKIFRQALALDERRAKFRHNPWSNPQVQVERAKAGVTPTVSDIRITESTTGEQSKIDWRKIKETLRLTHAVDRHQVKSGQRTHQELCKECNFDWERSDYREVWFVGCHSDVGGGAAPNEKKHTLANPSLLWMVQQLEMANLGILWSSNAFADIPTVRAYLDVSISARSSPVAATIPTSFTKGQRRPSALSITRPVFDRQEITELEERRLSDQKVMDCLKEDMADQVHDHLSRPSLYWLLEVVPLWKHFLGMHKARFKKLSINLGRGREIQDEIPLFHESVRLRKDLYPDYRPRANFEGRKPEYVKW